MQTYNSTIQAMIKCLGQMTTILSDRHFAFGGGAGRHAIHWVTPIGNSHIGAQPFNDRSLVTMEGALRVVLFGDPTVKPAEHDVPNVWGFGDTLIGKQIYWDGSLIHSYLRYALIQGYQQVMAEDRYPWDMPKHFDFYVSLLDHKQTLAMVNAAYTWLVTEVAPKAQLAEV